MDCLSSYSPGTSGCEAVTAVCVLPLFGLSIGGNRTKMSARRIHLICLTSDETKWSSTARCNQKMQLSLQLIVAMVIPSIHPVKLSPCSEMSTVSYSKYQSIIELIILSKHIKLLVQIRLHCHSVLCNGNSLVTQTLLTHWLCYCVTFIFIFCVCVSLCSVHPISTFPLQQQMWWATQLIVASFQSDRGLMLKSLHSWEGNRTQITEGLNHMHTQRVPQLQDLTAAQLWISDWMNLSDWLTDWLRLWYYGRWGGADRVSLNVTHPTSFLLPHYRRLWLVDVDYNKHSRARREREREESPTVCLLLSHDASTHVRAGSASQRAVSMDTPALGCTNETRWYSDSAHEENTARD